jgi:dUTP pyrophosphatase
MFDLAHGSPLTLTFFPHYDRARYGAPKYQTAHSCCFDLVAALGEGKTLTLAPGATAMVPTGLGIAKVEGHPVYAQGLWVPELLVRSRSGLAAKHGVHAIGGIVDADYPDEIKAILHNGGAAAFVVEDGLRIAQAAVNLALRIGGAEVAETVRTGGFGSSGK